MDVEGTAEIRELVHSFEVVVTGLDANFRGLVGSAVLEVLLVSFGAGPTELGLVVASVDGGVRDMEVALGALWKWR